MRETEWKSLLFIKHLNGQDQLKLELIQRLGNVNLLSKSMGIALEE
jgi:hypothetical protein